MTAGIAMSGSNAPVMTLSSHNRFALRAVAALLAAMYGLLASVGDGLHTLAHLPGGDCDSGCCEPAVEEPAGCDCGACPWDAQDETPEEGVLGFGQRSSGQAPHDHDCAVCQLLAVAGHGASAPASAILIDETPLGVVLSGDRAAASRRVFATDARGPPARA